MHKSENNYGAICCWMPNQGNNGAICCWMHKSGNNGAICCWMPNQAIMAQFIVECINLEMIAQFELLVRKIIYRNCSWAIDIIIRPKYLAKIRNVFSSDDANDLKSYGQLLVGFWTEAIDQCGNVRDVISSIIGVIGVIGVHPPWLYACLLVTCENALVLLRIERSSQVKAPDPLKRREFAGLSGLMPRRSKEINSWYSWSGVPCLVVHG